MPVDLRAIVSHGLLPTDESGGTGGYPLLDPDDVRLDVDIGDGTLGTIVLPIEADVEYGVSYGADGTEYTGTAILQPSAPAAPPNETMRRVELAIQNEGGEFRFKLSNDNPDEPIEIHSLQLLFERTDRV